MYSNTYVCLNILKFPTKFSVNYFKSELNYDKYSLNIFFSNKKINVILSSDGNKW